MELQAFAASLEPLRTCQFEVAVLKDRLCILAVAEGQKPAFMTYVAKERHCSPEVAARLLEVIGGLGLVARIVALNSDPWARTPRVPPVFLAAIEKLWHTRLGHRQIWIVRDILAIPRRVRRRPDATTGARLGYPPCCDAADLEGKVQKAERMYQVARDREPDKSDRALAEWFRADPELTDAEMDFVQGIEAERLHYMDQVDRRFPFVPHIPCPDCLQGSSDATQRLDEYYRDLAARVGLREKVIQAVQDMANHVALRSLTGEPSGTISSRRG